jgi:hypothetical protein
MNLWTFPGDLARDKKVASVERRIRRGFLQHISVQTTVWKWGKR